ncbi:MAG TPA: hypothetical protein VGR31_03780 [Planctomycetota bacterium]|jgi:hypothetical protein|nr:hypothetical protein [Planctomycetota bacterium]
MNSDPKTLREIARASWQDWSGFLRFVLLSALAGGAWFGAAALADWAVGRIWGTEHVGTVVSLTAGFARGALFASLALLGTSLLGCVRKERGSRTAAWVELCCVGFVLSSWSSASTSGAPIAIACVAAGAIAFYVAAKWTPWNVFWPLEDPEEEPRG